MKCHYEILNVPRDAEDAEIKTAYKKLALKWHPDKNLDNPEEAKEQFQLVQQAYEILMDKQERAWYDNHREQILRGSNSDFEDKSLNLFQYFTTTCFKGYGDDENGFYTIYRNVFEELIKEDMEHIEDKEELDEIPRFGDSTSDYDEIVGPFYAYWMGYCTKKSYVWLDPYNIKETRDRRVLKMIEKENKKVRLKAKKERNEEVRNLVAFVRKRDKRVQANAKKLEAKISENRRKQEEISKLKRLQRVQELNTSSNQAEWAKFDNVKSELEEIEKHLAEQFGDDMSNTDEDEGEDPDNLYCVACNKMFKTPKSFQNHETSKKHRENVELLKGTFLVGDNSSESDKQEETNCELNDTKDTIVDEIEDENKSQSDSDSETKKGKKNKKKNKKSKNVLRTKTVSETFSEGDNKLPNVLEDRNDSDDDFSTSKKQKKKGKRNNTRAKQTISNQDKFEEIQTKNDSVEENSDINRNCSAVENDDKSGDTRSKSKNKNKKHKKQIDEEELEDLDTNHCCVSCKANFPSKNKLFDHLKATGHSVYLSKNEKPNVKNKKKLKEK